MPGPGEYLHVIRACAIVTRSAIGLWAQGFRRFALPLAAGPEMPGGMMDTADEAMMRAISSTYVLPWSTCLTRSCALARVLRHRGLDARLQIGVAGPIQGLQAHAWVDLNGQAIGGDGKQAGRMAAFAIDTGAIGHD